MACIASIVKTLFSPASFSLICLVLQNAVLVLITSYTKSPRFNNNNNNNNKDKYMTSTVVLNQEIVKLIICLIIFKKEWKGLRDARNSIVCVLHGGNNNNNNNINIINNINNNNTTTIHIPDREWRSDDENNNNINNNNNNNNNYYYYYHYLPELLHEFKYQIFQKSTIRLAVPAALFTLQNYLIFIALTYLDPMIFQILSQTRIISTALFSVFLLDKKVSKLQWFAQVLLIIGVFISQRDYYNNYNFNNNINNNNKSKLKDNKLNNNNNNNSFHVQSPTFILLGASACILSSISSSFAGVYFEKVVKTTTPSLAIRNIQLSLFAIPLSFISMIICDVIPIYYNNLNNNNNNNNKSFNYFKGYTPIVYILVLVHAIGGLLVAVVVKYADNILKGFATSIAIIISGVFISIFWDFQPTFGFIVGSCFVIISIILYQYDDSKKKSVMKKVVI